MTLSKERMGEIALNALIQKMTDEGNIPSMEGMRRSLPEEAKKLGISQDEARVFIKEIVTRAIGRRLGCDQVSLVFKW